MPRDVPIKFGSTGKALTIVGTMYESPAEALKEEVSNAIDEHIRAKREGRASDPCVVTISLNNSKIEVSYPYGMSERKFEDVLQSVADSSKVGSDIPQIGQLGIGLFAYQQFGKKCECWSRETHGCATFKVVLREGADNAEFQGAKKSEALLEPGIRKVVSQLKVKPLQSRGPLCRDRFSAFLAEKFAAYLQSGQLKLLLAYGTDQIEVAPPRISLPRLIPELSCIWAAGRLDWAIKLELYFDATKKSRVAIRHMSLPLVEDVSAIQALGLEESVFASGYVRGFIDADFLKPAPARKGFQEGEEWLYFLTALYEQVWPELEREVEQFLEEERRRRMTELQREAVDLASEILDLEEFRDLELLGGLRRRAGEPPEKKPKPAKPDKPEKPEKPEEPQKPEKPTPPRQAKSPEGDQADKRGSGIIPEEIPFEEGPSRHSRFISGKVQINKLNPDYVAIFERREGTAEERLGYCTLMIGKETISFNDKSQGADPFLEHLLSFDFRVREMAPKRAKHKGKRVAVRH